MKRAIIVGCEGQDGRLLYDLLADRDYHLLGIGRNGTYANSSFPCGRVDILDAAAVDTVVREVQPDELYYLAAFHQSSENVTRLNDREIFRASYEVQVFGLLNFLQSVLDHRRKTRVFYAATSHIFGEPIDCPQTEETSLKPISAYGISKAAGVEQCRFYRRLRSLYVSVGILYNHESEYRRHDFVSQKIAYAVVRIKRGLQQTLFLGDLSASVDWGWATDYVDAMARIMSLPAGDEFIIATGEAHTVRDFAEQAFRQVGLDWKEHVVEQHSVLNRKSAPLLGNPSKLQRMTGWHPTISFSEMVHNLVRSAEQQLEKESK